MFILLVIDFLPSAYNAKNENKKIKQKRDWLSTLFAI